MPYTDQILKISGLLANISTMDLPRNAQELRGAPRGVPAGGERGAIHDRTQELRKPQAQGNKMLGLILMYNTGKI